MPPVVVENLSPPQPPEVEGGEKVVCAHCGRLIEERYFVSLERLQERWHTACFCCADCGDSLEEQERCFFKDGKIFCKQDYQERYRCAQCRQFLEPDNLVIKARGLIFHHFCLACVACQRVLRPGEKYCFKEGSVFCEVHAGDQQNLHVHTEQSTPFYTPLHSPALTLGEHNNNTSPTGHVPGSSAPKMGRSRKRRLAIESSLQQIVPDDAYSYSMGMTMTGVPEMELDEYGMMSGHGGMGRTKRIRTSFKHHQLVKMKKYFAINHNPDAKDLKRLSDDTGLAKRVLQVWFQNARAKYRRTQPNSPGSKEEGSAAPDLEDCESFGNDASNSESSSPAAEESHKEELELEDSAVTEKQLFMTNL